MVRGKTGKWLSGVCCVCALGCMKGCVLSFHDYPEADLCAASRDAGIQPSTAPDPALRGCEAGAPAPLDPNAEQAGAAGMGGEP